MIIDGPIKADYGHATAMGNARISTHKLTLGLLFSAAAVFFILFTAVGLQIHAVFGTSAYDLGIFDQAFWQYSQLLTPFNTVRGMNILGDHFSPIAFVFAPLYRLWPDLAWPLALQALSIAAGGVILYSIARHLLPTRAWVASAVALSYFLHPAVHNTLLWQYHELVLASGLYMALIWAYLKDRHRLFLVMLVLLLACREDMPFTLVAFGVVALIDKRWRYGWWAILLSLAWWLVATRVAMPYFNGVGYFRHVHGTPALLLANIANPEFYLGRLRDPESIRYIAQILIPVGLIGLFSPRYLLPALPTLAANVLIGGYNTQIGFHYSVSIMPFMFLAALTTLQRVEHQRISDRFPSPQNMLVWTLLAASMWLSYQYSAMNLRQLPSRYIYWQEHLPKRDMLEKIKQLVGSDGVATSDFLLPQLSHRENIYLFPNPWKVHAWGVAGENPHHPNKVKYIVIPRQTIPEFENLYDYLIESGTFEKIGDEHDVVVLRRLKLEAEDRAVAVSNYLNFFQTVPPAFTKIGMSPIFPTAAREFGRLDVDLAAMQKSMISGSTTMPNLKVGEVLKLELGEIGMSDNMTRYVRAELWAAEPVMAHLDVGSDDGVTIWVNQKNVHEKIVTRAANIDDDHVAFPLKRGKNVIVFRVNNGGGAWRLAARIKTRLCRADCIAQLAQ